MERSDGLRQKRRGSEALLDNLAPWHPSMMTTGEALTPRINCLSRSSRACVHLQAQSLMPPVVPASTGR
jgi:hypothetical protein